MILMEQFQVYQTSSFIEGWPERYLTSMVTAHLPVFPSEGGKWRVKAIKSSLERVEVNKSQDSLLTTRAEDEGELPWRGTEIHFRNLRWSVVTAPYKTEETVLFQHLCSAESRDIILGSWSVCQQKSHLALLKHRNLWVENSLRISRTGPALQLVDKPQQDIIFFPPKLLYNSGLNASILVVSISALVLLATLQKVWFSDLSFHLSVPHPTHTYTQMLFLLLGFILLWQSEGCRKEMPEALSDPLIRTFLGEIW